jgi:hypothetical protein
MSVHSWDQWHSYMHCLGAQSCLTFRHAEILSLLIRHFSLLSAVCDTTDWTWTEFSSTVVWAVELTDCATSSDWSGTAELSVTFVWPEVRFLSVISFLSVWMLLLTVVSVVSLLTLTMYESWTLSNAVEILCCCCWCHIVTSYVDGVGTCHADVYLRLGPGIRSRWERPSFMIRSRLGYNPVCLRLSGMISAENRREPLLRHLPATEILSLPRNGGDGRDKLKFTPCFMLVHRPVFTTLSGSVCVDRFQIIVVWKCVWHPLISVSCPTVQIPTYESNDLSVTLSLLIIASAAEPISQPWMRLLFYV